MISPVSADRFQLRVLSSSSLCEACLFHGIFILFFFFPVFERVSSVAAKWDVWVFMTVGLNKPKWYPDVPIMQLHSLVCLCCYSNLVILRVQRRTETGIQFVDCKYKRERKIMCYSKCLGCGRLSLTSANVSSPTLKRSWLQLTLSLTALKQTWAAVRWNVSAHVSLLSNDTHELALNFN